MYESPFGLRLSALAVRKYTQPWRYTPLLHCTRVKRPVALVDDKVVALTGAPWHEHHAPGGNERVQYGRFGPFTF